MKQESGHIDALTNFFGYAYGSKKIDEVLQRGGGHDTALLFQVDNWEGFCELAGDKAADFSLAKLSFLLTKLFHKTEYLRQNRSCCFFCIQLWLHGICGYSKKIAAAVYAYENNSFSGTLFEGMPAACRCQSCTEGMQLSGAFNVNAIRPCTGC